MKNVMKVVLFISVGGLVAFNIFNSLLHKVADNIFVGGTVIIHNHSNNDSKISGVIQSVDIQQNIPATISESPPKTNIPENIPPVTVNQSSKDTKPAVISQASQDVQPVIVRTISNDTLAAKIASKDPSPHEKIDRTELIYQFIIKHSDIFTRRKNESPDNESHAKISEDMKTFEPQKISLDIRAVTLSDDSAPGNFMFTGWLKTRNSKDTHSFTLTHSCAANISFTPSDGDKAYYVLTVRGDSGHVITRKTIESENLHTDTGNIYLRPGNYTASIERGYSWSGKPYQITVNTSDITNAEQESNNSPQTANVIPLNENVSASSGTHNDTDYFTFMLEKPMMIRPCLEFREARNGRMVYDKKLYRLDFLNTDKEPFTFRGDNKPSGKIKPFILETGKYIIAVSRIEDTNKLMLGLHEYTLRVEAQELM